MDQATFSVIIPCRNRRELARRAIRSALKQEPRPEVIVVDDGSNDGSFEAFQREFVAESQVVILRQPQGGASAARNYGSQMASCPWLLFLDSDDELTENAIATLRSAVENPQICTVCMGARIVGDDGHGTQVRKPRDLGPAYNGCRGLFLAGSYAIRGDVFRAINGFAPDCRANQHNELALRLVQHCKRHGLAIDVADGISVRIYEHSGGHLRDNLESLLEGSLYILKQHDRQLRKSPRHFADWCSITGVYAAKLRRYPVARGLWKQSLMASRHRPSDLVRLLLSYSSPLARQIWKAP